MLEHVPQAILATEIGPLLANTVVHLLHAAGCVLQVPLPHVRGCMREDDVDDVCAVNGRVRVDGPGSVFDAAHHDVLLHLTVTYGQVLAVTLV